MRIELPRLFQSELALQHVKTSSFGAPCRFEDGSKVSRLFHLRRGPAVVRFTFAGAADGQGQWLDVSCLKAPCWNDALAHTEDPSAGIERELRQLASTFWGLDDDLESCYAAFAGDGLMGRLARRFSGLRLVRGPDLYETLLVAIVGQQVSVASAQAIRRRLMAAIGDRAEVDGYLYMGYPAADKVLAAGADELRALGFSRQKARYAVCLAEWAAEGRLDESYFAGMSDTAAADDLTKIPGVGRWTAEIGLMRGLGRLDVFPAADLGLQVAVQRIAGLPDRPTEKGLRSMAEAWSGWRSYAAFYLWMTLQTKGYA